MVFITSIFSRMRLLLVALLFSVVFLFTSCSSSDTTLSCPAGEQLVGKSCVSLSSCGDFVCDSTELGQGSCALDCGEICKAVPSDVNSREGACSGNVQVYCDGVCEQSRDVLDRFDSMQESVVNCLGSYFSYLPPRVTYRVVHDGMGCNSESCCCREGGLTSVRDVRMPGVPGLTVRAQSTVMTRDHVMPDEHETTHYFLFHMLGEHSLWFSEAVAISTNERVQCDVSAYSRQGGKNSEVISYMSRGDAYLKETPVDVASGVGIGVRLAGGRVVNVELYYDIRDGRYSLQTRDEHVVGALFIMGLQEDYDCGANCVRDIVEDLYTTHKQGCMSQACVAVNTDAVYASTNRIVGVNTEELFTMLRLK